MSDRERKRRLRQALRSRRAAIASTDVERWSKALTDTVVGHSLWREATAIAAFYGVRNEPQTDALLAAAFTQGKRIALPRIIDREAAILELVVVRSLDELQPGAYGLMEPLGGDELVGAADLDLMLVPGLGFSSSGGRIGGGKGFYDRIMAPIRERASPVRLGVCFASFLDPIEGEIPTEAHDVPMHHIATGGGVIKCR